MKRLGVDIAKKSTIQEENNGCEAWMPSKRKNRSPQSNTHKQKWIKVVNVIRRYWENPNSNLAFTMKNLQTSVKKICCKHTVINIKMPTLNQVQKIFGKILNLQTKDINKLLFYQKKYKISNLSQIPRVVV